MLICLDRDSLDRDHAGLPMCLKTPSTPFAHLSLFRSLAELSLLPNENRGKLQRAAKILMLGTVPIMMTPPSHMMGALVFQIRSPYLGLCIDVGPIVHQLPDHVLLSSQGSNVQGCVSLLKDTTGQCSGDEATQDARERWA